MNLKKILYILRNPLQWYREHNARVEQEARDYTRTLLEKESASCAGDCAELENLLEDNPFGLEALSAFSGEADNRFNDPLYRIAANNRYSTFNREVLTNRHQFEQRAGEEAVNEWGSTYHHFSELLTTVMERDQAKRRSECE